MVLNYEHFSHANSYHTNSYHTNQFMKQVFFPTWGDDAVQGHTSKPVLVQLQCISINNTSNNSAC